MGESASAMAGDYWNLPCVICGMNHNGLTCGMLTAGCPSPIPMVNNSNTLHNICVLCDEPLTFEDFGKATCSGCRAIFRSLKTLMTNDSTD